MNNIATKRAMNPLHLIAERLDGTHARNEGYRKTLRKFSQKIIDRKRAECAKVGAAGGSDDGPRNDMLDHFLDLKMDDGANVSDEQLCDMVLKHDHRRTRHYRANHGL